MEFGLFLEFPRRESESEHQAFADAFEVVDAAENLGVDSVWLAEYHFVPGRALAAPITIASAIAARTNRIRIGLAVVLLPLGQPVRIAEEIATLDHVSNGWVEFGIGRGTFPNVHEGFSVPFEESRGRFEESLEVILKAWTTESFSFDGEYYSYRDLNVIPKPYQTPHPPVHVGVTSPDTFPIVGRMGYPILINPSRVFALSELAPSIDAYHQAWQEAGHQGHPKVGLRIPVYLAATPERAYSEPKESALLSMESLGNRVAEFAAYGETTKGWQSQAEHIRSMSYDDWLRDKVAYGTPETVTDRLSQLRDELGLDQIMFEVNSGTQIPQHLQLNNLRLLTEQVIPHFK